MPKRMNKVEKMNDLKAVQIRVDPIFWWKVRQEAARRKQTVREFVVESCTRAMRER